MLAVAALLALAACADNTATTSSRSGANATNVAGATTMSGSNSVGVVSDALGQRLDGMLGPRQTGR